jgi:hypothetical protein
VVDHWVICFQKSDNIGLWRLFTLFRQDYGHVFATKFIPELKSWLVVDFSSERLHIDLLMGEESDKLFLKMMSSTACVEIQCKNDIIQLPRLNYCTSFIKHIIGIKKFWILTPYQLYCELIKLGGKRMFETEKET